MDEAVLNHSQVLQPTILCHVIDIILTSPAMSNAQGQPCSSVFVDGVNYNFSPSNTRSIDDLITFFETPIRQSSMPHEDALVLT